MRQAWVTVTGTSQSIAVPHNKFSGKTASRGNADLLAKDRPHR
jgi:hypothetical protein